ncbi:MAG: hypothetical protein Q4F66_08825 [Clostridium sp.]|nr:hypothetical protein [Clostridium sp.]
MIKIKLEFSKSKKIIFKVKIDEDEKRNVLFRRAVIEGKPIKKNRLYNYEIPLRYFMPICSNIKKGELILDKKSILSYLEFSDYYDANYYTEVSATPAYMKKWREEGCPDIYKITIDKDTYEVKKEIAFRKPKVSFGEFNF